MTSIYTGQLIALCALMALVGAAIGFILSDLVRSLIAAHRRPMATRLPRPRVDCVVRSDPYIVSPGRGR